VSHPLDKLLGPLLKDVSRSFYQTLRILPGRIRPQIGLAYLLARTTDTVADTELVPLEQRLRALQALRERIRGSSQAALDFGGFAQRQGSDAEGRLLERVELSLGALTALTPPDRERVVAVLNVITEGQELDLRRFAGASAAQVIALRTDEELDDYTYRVAGCVGEFWTKMCRAHLFPGAKLDDGALLASGVRFGKGLQFVNILRDLPADLRQGRCYLPLDALTAASLRPEDLLEPANETKLRPLYNVWLGRAEGHLQAGWTYTNTLPWRCVRLRLACAWPILIGIKVTRRQVRRIMLRSLLYYPCAAAWRKLARFSVP
jgi:farnesyl-diphosphate farnesyltransferase